MRSVKIGIIGLGRGGHYIKNILANNGTVTAVCDNNPKLLEKTQKQLGDGVRYYSDVEEFLADDSYEAVLLANFFHQHAPLAIRLLEKNVHVLSECASNGTMAEGVALVRAAQKSKAIYMLAENYPYMLFNQEMKKVYEQGSLGKILYAEGEYNHPLDPKDSKTIASLRPFEKHWRNYLPRTYYVTHSLAPLMYITGSKPVRVTAMPVFSPQTEEGLFSPLVGDKAAIITCLNDDNSVYRVTGCAGFGNEENSYRICCEKGQMENLRGHKNMVSLRYSGYAVPEGGEAKKEYEALPEEKDAELIKAAGHGGGDFYVIKEFFRCVIENKPHPFDVYFSTRMASVGILAHRSLLEKGVPYDIPDFSKEEDCKKYENDTLSPFYGYNGEEPTLPCCSEPDYRPTDSQLAFNRQVLEQYNEG